MRLMFAYCSRLTSLDIRNFTVDNAWWNMEYMFAGCSNLVTIYCNDSWSEDAYGLFFDCNELVGENGTTYEDYESQGDEHDPYCGFARPDGDDPGFFTYQDIDLTLSDNQDNSNTIAIYDHKEIANVALSGRTLYKTGDWNTLCLPFSLTAEQLAASPLAGYTELRTLSDAQYNAGTLTLNFTPATGDDAVTSIEAGIPYIIKWNSSEENIVNPTFTNVIICDTPEDERIIWTEDVSFMGTYDPKPLTSANSNILYLGAGNTLYYPSANMTINSFRAYFELNLTSAQQVKAINLNFGDEEAASIKTISESSDHSESSDAYFSLDGRRLNDKPATAGLYIINGKKVVIK
jgi:surface protein